MKYLIGIVLIGAVGYMTYAYVQAEDPKTDTTITRPNFGGQWNIFMNTISGAQCATASVSGTVVNGQMKSVVKTADGVQSSFDITVDADGIIRNRKSANLTSFEGSIHGGVGSGKWSDKYSCAGTFTMRRPEQTTEYIPNAVPKAPSKGTGPDQVKTLE